MDLISERLPLAQGEADRAQARQPSRPRWRTGWIALIGSLLLWCWAPLATALPSKLIEPLAGDDADARSAALAAIVATGDPLVTRVLEALGDGRLHVDAGVAVMVQDGKAMRLDDGSAVAMPKSEAIIANNRLRAEIETIMAGLQLESGDPKVRLEAAKALAESAEAGQRDAIARAIEKQADPAMLPFLRQALARIDLADPDPARRAQAIRSFASSDDPQVRSLLAERRRDEADPKVQQAIDETLAQIASRLARSEWIGRVLTGISLGSVLLLAALGLAITYGVMGVINMAHGELLMVGAYATYLTQSAFRAWLPQWVDWYVVAAVPVAFLLAGAVGMVIERTVIRFLYGRALETLLATFGVSLLLAQGARSLFGAQNVELANPSWMSGGLELTANLVLPWNRIVIVGFALCVLAAVALLLVRTSLGLYVRAVTQNRRMASCLGVPTGRTDALAFGLGSGIAGLGGVALSQFSNVGPDMGQAYIVDSFMVVVLGGVGQLAGTVIASFGLGVVSKFLEGWTGAVIAKILVLVFIIIFIQRRPQGLFALKGRQVDA
jgi:urea transport system permease protein